MNINDKNIPIIGKQALQCILCEKDVNNSPIGGLICMNETCNRFGLITLVAKDPVLKAQQERELRGEGGDES